MFNSVLLDVAIGMAFTFLLLSLIVTGIMEVVHWITAKRSQTLKKAISEILNDKFNKNWAEFLYEHPLVDGLKRTERSLPSYISSNIFALSLIDIISNESKTINFNKNLKGATTLDEQKNQDLYQAFKSGVASLNESDVKQILHVFVENSTDLATLKENVEKWFDEYMDRVSGWFKRYTKHWVMGISLGVTLFLNVDSIQLFNSMWNDANLRNAVVSSAQNYISKNSGTIGMVSDTVNIDTAMTKIEDAYDNLNVLNLPIGWHCTKREIKKYNEDANNTDNLNYCNCVKKQLFPQFGWHLLGWLITAFLISLGAPFWFELLNKLVSIRSTGKKPVVDKK
jgi:hypothetical protein